MNATVSGTPPLTPGQSGDVGAIPLWLFISMSALTLLGVAYSLAILAFNMKHRRTTIIKMTSPNINVVIVSGAVIGYLCIVLFGIEHLIPLQTYGKLLQAGAWLLTMSFTLLYGSLFSKICRIHMIFTNLTLSGKTARDEHLLLVVFILLVVDMVILLPWQLIDPIMCSTTEFARVQSFNTTQTLVHCSSRHQLAWVLSIYVYKAVIIIAGLYFTWKTRRVTLPALRDSRQVTVAVSIAILLSLTALPVLLVIVPSATIKYSVGGLAIWFNITATVSLLFLSKILLLRREWKKRREQQTVDGSTRLQFSESMARIKGSGDAVGLNGRGRCRLLRQVCGCLACCTGNQPEDRYAQEVLSTEIETLKRTVKEKDVTIRELTDRLFIGADRFQEYLATPKPQQQQQQQPMVHFAPPIQPYRKSERQMATPLQRPNSDMHDEGDDYLRDYRLRRFYSDEIGGSTGWRLSETGSCSSCDEHSVNDLYLETVDQSWASLNSRSAIPRQLSVADLVLGFPEPERISINRKLPQEQYDAVYGNFRHVARIQNNSRIRSIAGSRGSPPSVQDSAFDNTSPSSVEYAEVHTGIRTISSEVPSAGSAHGNRRSNGRDRDSIPSLSKTGRRLALDVDAIEKDSLNIDRKQTNSSYAHASQNPNQSNDTNYLNNVVAHAPQESTNQSNHQSNISVRAQCENNKSKHVNLSCGASTHAQQDDSQSGHVERPSSFSAHALQDMHQSNSVKVPGSILAHASQEMNQSNQIQLQTGAHASQNANQSSHTGYKSVAIGCYPKTNNKYGGLVTVTQI